MRVWCKAQETPALHEIYTEKATRNLHCGAFYIMSTVWGYYLLKDSVWLPWYLGGQNPKADILTVYEWGFTEHTPKGIHTYVFFTYGYHLFSTFEHLFLKERGTDFREMVIHHIATLCLIFGMLLTNMMGVGTLIAWYHDLTDVFV